MTKKKAKKKTNLKAVDRARRLGLELKSQGHSYREIAERLKTGGFTNSKGKFYTTNSAYTLVNRTTNKPTTKPTTKATTKIDQAKVDRLALAAIPDTDLMYSFGYVPSTRLVGAAKLLKTKSINADQRIELALLVLES